MGPPPPPHPPTFKAQARPSIGMSLSRPNRTDPLSPPWPSATSSTGHLQSPSMSRNQSSTTNMVSEDLEVSPSIDEEEEEAKRAMVNSLLRWRRVKALESTGIEKIRSPRSLLEIPRTDFYELDSHKLLSMAWSPLVGKLTIRKPQSGN